MSALLPDERFDGSAIDAIEEAKPTPPSPQRGPTMVLIHDESGPLDSIRVSSWAHYPAATLLQLVRAAFPGLTVLSVEWAPEPRKYSATGCDVLVARIPGTHAVSLVPPKPKLKSPPKKPRRAPVGNDWSPLNELGHSHAGHWRDRMLPVEDAPKPRPPTLDDTETVNTCPCCSTAYTARTFAELPLLSARDHREGATIVHEVMRTCRCGSTRMVTTTRPATEVLP